MDIVKTSFAKDSAKKEKATGIKPQERPIDREQFESQHYYAPAGKRNRYINRRIEEDGG